MKGIEPELIELLKQGWCTPQIARIAKSTHEPSTTIHYNIKRMETEKKIKAYKAVFDYQKIGQGFCTFVLINLSPGEYGNPEKIAKILAKHEQIESIDIITGDWEIIAKIRTKDQNEYYEFVKKALSMPGIAKTTSLVSFRQIKTEFVS
ncbi:Lrp/AsnC family transcriptional regulator [Candidatus Woesearchaeota archaeon]|nr:Lrp/AsnC family transcriptional regulator [Candidatus Woesearchaeota archaeon]